MAAIDELYGDYAQYKDLRGWVEIKMPGRARYFYEWPKEWQIDGDSHPIAHFPHEVDVALVRYCPLAWVRARILEQYGA